MAGGGGGDEDNPCPVNVVALIDILMCLLLFYMCSAKFAALEGRLDAWLPKDKGANAGPPPPKILDEIRVKLSWENEGTVRRFGQRIVAEDSELQQLIVNQHASLLAGKKKEDQDPSVIIEASAAVPWRDVIGVMDMCKRNKIDKIEFAFTADAAGLDLGGGGGGAK